MAATSPKETSTQMTIQRCVLIIGADGLRPDLYDPFLMPNVAALEASGTRLIDYHASYPSHTRVNMSSLATGATPGQHGIVANTMLVPGATNDHIIDTSDYQHLDALAPEALLARSLSDVLAASNERVAVAGTGSSGTSALWTINDRSRIVNTSSAYGIADLYDLREKLGEIPEPNTPQIARANYATRAVRDLYLEDDRNRVIVMWLNEPDASLHLFGLGSPESVEAMKGVDGCVGTLIDTLDRLGRRDQFDIIFMSDHGHSTVKAHSTLREYLHQAERELRTLPQLVTASDYIYARPGAPSPTASELLPLIDWLYAQSWCDLIFAGSHLADDLPTIIPLTALWNGKANDRQPLLAVSPAWSVEENAFGIPGTVDALTTQAALKSSHGSTSPYDMHALMIISGPSFQEGRHSAIPAGAIDLAPTILTLLNKDIPNTMDGRPLHEALRSTYHQAIEPKQEIFLVNVAGEQRGLVLERVGTSSYVHGSAQGQYHY
jgi:predicted AlkP superfamily pyrophosphatase or phosphodiesterase